MKATQPPSTRLLAADFRYFLAWIQGADPRKTWSLYQSHRVNRDLDRIEDLRQIRGVTRTLLDVVASFAKRSGDPASAALLRRDPDRLRIDPRRRDDFMPRHPDIIEIGPVVSIATAHARSIRKRQRPCRLV